MSARDHSVANDCALGHIRFERLGSVMFFSDVLPSLAGVKFTTPPETCGPHSPLF